MTDGRRCSGNNPVEDLLQNFLSDHLMDLKNNRINKIFLGDLQLLSISMHVRQDEEQFGYG